MIVRIHLFFILCLLFAIFPAQAKMISAERGEIPLEAVLGDKAVFDRWVADFRDIYNNHLDSIQDLTPTNLRVVSQRQSDGMQFLTIAFDYPKHSPLHGKIGGGVLAVPKQPISTWPLIVAIHGHEHPQQGMYPTDLFTKNCWPLDLMERGYVVWAPVSMYHTEIEAIGRKHSYIPVWTKIISEGLKALSSLSAPPYSGYATFGVSAGGQIAYSLMAYRQDIRAGVFAGAVQPLDFLRREYRLMRHPHCWDIPWLSSYTPVQALIAPRPVQFQLGLLDPWFPNGVPFPKQGDWYPGSSRDVLSDEIGGQVLILRELWKIMGNGGGVGFHIHEGGHQMDSQ